MEGLFTPVSTSYQSRGHLEEQVKRIQESSEASPGRRIKISDPTTALQALQSELDFEILGETLTYLVRTARHESGFDIRQPGPIAAQLITALVLNILPNYWSVLREEASLTTDDTFGQTSRRQLILFCLRSLTGVNAILARLKILIQNKDGVDRVTGSELLKSFQNYLDVIESLLMGDRFLLELWNHASDKKSSLQKILWRETIVLVGGGKILNIAAESDAMIRDSGSAVEETRWIADGRLYVRWLTSNIIRGCQSFSSPDSSWNPLSEMLTKALRLGHSELFYGDLLKLILGDDGNRSTFTIIAKALDLHERKKLLTYGIRLLSHEYLNTKVNHHSQWWKEDSERVAAAAGFLSFLIAQNEDGHLQLIHWLIDLTGAGVGDTIGIRRAAIATLSSSKADIETIFAKSMHQFGEQLYIKHASAIQQEVHCQVILLSAGYIYRASKVQFSKLMRSSGYLTAISHRLAASSERARFLGMVVGEALSKLADKPDAQMDFKLEELNSEEANWYKDLTSITDAIGSFMAVKMGSRTTDSHQSEIITSKLQPPTRTKDLPSNSRLKIRAIEEISDDVQESEHDGLLTYTKPDSDQEDSDEDPTLVQRNKTTAPVYIRDLITYLRDTENYERQKLGVSTAASLIRRKAAFGTEVKDHIEELATLLVGLQDKFDLENFQDTRLQGMIAVLLSQPSAMGPWFSRTFFEGDYSISQRSSVLVVLSMSARELGGFGTEDSNLTSMKDVLSSSFPSKKLPPRLHKLYASHDSNAIETLSSQLSQSMIQPIAASMGDKATGPDVLKIRTLSSRIEVEAKRKPPSINRLAPILANNFFLPLTGRFAAYLKAYGAKHVIFEPYLLSNFLKTLSLIFHAGGPNNVQLSQITTEFWDLLLSLRNTRQGDKIVAEAIMFGFLTLLETNTDKRRLAEIHGRSLMETRRWTEDIFQVLEGGSKEDDKLRSLAAAVLLRIKDVVEKYQALLVGEISTL